MTFRKLETLIYGFGFCLLVFGFIAGCQNKQLYKETKLMMGTFIEVTSGDKKAAEIVFSEIARIEGLLSKYKETSEVSFLNKSGYLKAGRDTFYIIKRSKEFSNLSAGAFDITVGPLLDLWGFTGKRYYVPTPSQIKEVLRRVSSDKIILDEKNSVVQFKIPGMKVDLGGIAKGYAVDCAVARLKENGINNCLVNAGGNIYCLGDKFGKPWKIAIRDPKNHDRALEFLYLKDNAVATSGNYEHAFIKDDRRYCHIFNPKTGYPVDNGIDSVTVIALDATTADALSTTIFVLGKEKAKALLTQFPGTKWSISP